MPADVAGIDTHNRHEKRRVEALRRRGFTDAETPREPQPPTRHHLDRRTPKILAAAGEGSDDDVLTTKQMSEWWGNSPEWFEIARSKGYGPPFNRLSPRRIRYHRGTAKSYLLERMHRHTAEYADPEAPRQGRAAGSKVVDGKVVPPDADDAYSENAAGGGPAARCSVR